MARVIFHSIVLAIFVSSSLAVVPSYIEVCERRHPNLNKCVEDSVLKLRPKLKAGIPELDVPSLDRLPVERIPLADLPDFKAIATNVLLGGLANFKINYLQLDLDKQKIDIQLTFPEVTLKSDYDVKARILVPIKEKGPIDIVTNGVKATVTLLFKKVQHRNKERLYFPTMTTKLVIADYKANFLPGANNNAIAQAINSVLAESRQEIIASMTPGLETAVSKKVLEISNQIAKHFTYDELFPDNA